MQRINLADFEAEAAQTLERTAWDYYRSGARDERTVADNVAAYARLRLRYRVLAGIAEVSTATEVLGHRIDLPVLVAPTAFHRLAHPRGEAATAEGAGRAGTLFTLSTLSNTPIEEVCAATSGPVWFQLYVYRDRGATAALVDRVREAGASAIVLTVDAPVLGTRERDVRNRFRLPPGLDMPNATAEPYRVLGTSEIDSALAAWVADNLDPSLGWSDLDWLCERAGLPVLVKGVVRGDDAAACVDHGAAGVVVSNHGGRQLDTSVATIDALAEVVDAVAGRVEVLLDGGIRRGTDVLKALALGAKAVAVGRPALWGLAVGGADGVAEVLGMLQAELTEAMLLCGAADPGLVTRDLVATCAEGR